MAGRPRDVGSDADEMTRGLHPRFTPSEHAEIKRLGRRAGVIPSVLARILILRAVREAAGREAIDLRIPAAPAPAAE